MYLLPDAELAITLRFFPDVVRTRPRRLKGTDESYLVCSSTNFE